SRPRAATRRCARSGPYASRDPRRDRGGRIDCSRYGLPSLPSPAPRPQPLQPPWPLQSFCALQPCLSVLQPPCPLQSFRPLQACLAAAVAGAPEAAGVVVAPPLVSDGELAGGVDPPQPTRIPPTAAASIVLVMFIVPLPCLWTITGLGLG